MSRIRTWAEIVDEIDPPPTNERTVSKIGIILGIFLDNVTALLNGRLTDWDNEHLLSARRDILRHNFFDRAHRPQELLPRRRPLSLGYFNWIVLLARLMRIIARDENEPGVARIERLQLRTLVLDMPLFDREYSEDIGVFQHLTIDEEGRSVAAV